MVGIPASAPSAEGGFLAGVPRASGSGHCWPQGTGQSGRGPWLCLAHSRLLRGWPGARVPEGRREPFKETFLCLKKKKKETRNTETHNKVSGLAGQLSWNAQLWVVGGGGHWGAAGHEGHPGIRPSDWGSSAAPQISVLGGDREGTWAQVPFFSTPWGGAGVAALPLVSEDTCPSCPCLKMCP